MKFRDLYKTIAALLLVAIGGCAQYTPVTAPTETPAKDASYLYGRFWIDSQKKALALDGYMTMGFKLDCDDGQTYTIRFSQETSLELVKIAPSKCSFTELVYTNSDGQIRSRKPAPADAIRHEKFEAGKAYYLGDFFATASSYVSYRTLHSEWHLTSARINYAGTTEEMKKTYANFASVPTEIKLLIYPSHPSYSTNPNQETDLQCFVNCKDAGGSSLQACREKCEMR